MCQNSVYLMPLARFGRNISLTYPLSHELCKKVFSIYFSYSLPYIVNLLSTSECNQGYMPHIEMGIILQFSSCHQLGLV